MRFLGKMLLLLLIANCSHFVKHTALADDENREPFPIFPRGSITDILGPKPAVTKGGPGKEIATNEPPEWVCRMDTRDPDIIFKEGFKKLGGNYDLLQHMDGTSKGYTKKGKPDSGYVSTSSDPDACMAWAREFMRKGPNVFYVYKIRADETLYNLRKTLMYAFSKIENAPTEYEKYAEVAEGYKEWVAVKNIGRDHIKEATQYKKICGNLGAGETRANPKYDKNLDNSNSRGNTHVYVPKGLWKENQ